MFGQFCPMMERNMLLGTFRFKVSCVNLWPLAMTPLRLLLYESSFGMTNFVRLLHFSATIFHKMRVAS